MTILGSPLGRPSAAPGRSKRQPVLLLALANAGVVGDCDVCDVARVDANLHRRRWTWVKRSVLAQRLHNICRWS